MTPLNAGFSLSCELAVLLLTAHLGCYAGRGLSTGLTFLTVNAGSFTTKTTT